jgi:Ca2+-binding RTX toxin-like protein
MKNLLTDITAPTVEHFNPDSGAADVAIDSDLVITFSESVSGGTGAIVLHYGSANGPEVERFDGASASNELFDGHTLTINPTHDLSYNTHYFVSLDKESIEDYAGNHLNSSTIYDFITEHETESSVMPPMSPFARNGASVNPDRYTGPAASIGNESINFQLVGDTTAEVVYGSIYNDFINVEGGDDAVNGGSGNDIIDGGSGSSFLTGGEGSDIFFIDGKSDEVTWSTITDWHNDEQLSFWGWKPGTSKIVMWEENGAEGYKGITMHADLNGDGTIDTSVTFSGLAHSDLMSPIDNFDGLLWFGASPVFSNTATS